MTVPEAAEALGITADAVRSRIKRGTLPTVHEGARVFVIAEDVGPTDRARPTNRPGEGGPLVDALQDQIRYLREQLDTERAARTEERRRPDTIVAQLTSRIPAIEAPQGTPPETPSDAPGGPETPSAPPDRGDAPGPERPAERPWWRRVFGG